MVDECRYRQCRQRPRVNRTVLESNPRRNKPFTNPRESLSNTMPTTRIRPEQRLLVPSGATTLPRHLPEDPGPFRCRRLLCNERQRRPHHGFHHHPSHQRHPPGTDPCCYRPPLGEPRLVLSDRPNPYDLISLFPLRKRKKNRSCQKKSRAKHPLVRPRVPESWNGHHRRIFHPW